MSPRLNSKGETNRLTSVIESMSSLNILQMMCPWAFRTSKIAKPRAQMKSKSLQMSSIKNLLAQSTWVCKLIPFTFLQKMTIINKKKRIHKDKERNKANNKATPNAIPRKTGLRSNIYSVNQTLWGQIDHTKRFLTARNIRELMQRKLVTSTKWKRWNLRRWNQAPAATWLNVPFPLELPNNSLLVRRWRLSRICLPESAWPLLAKYDFDWAFSYQVRVDEWMEKLIQRFWAGSL